VAIRGHHRDLAERLAAWPAPRDPELWRYALLHAVGHRIAAGECRAIHALASNGDFLAAKAQALGIDEVEFDVLRAAEACLAAGHMALHSDLDRLARTLARESSSLQRNASDAAAQLVRRVLAQRPPGDPARGASPAAPRRAGCAHDVATPPTGAAARSRLMAIARCRRPAMRRSRSGSLGAWFWMLCAYNILKVLNVARLTGPRVDPPTGSWSRCDQPSDRSPSEALATNARHLQLADLHELCERYVPVTSRHPKARGRSTSRRGGRRTSSATS